jgi:hypothetical protein
MVFPTLFNNWGPFAPFAGFLWFGLLFFAAITSSLAMGQPLMSFLQNEFKVTRERSALLFGLLLLPLAFLVAIFHSSTFFDDFDFWAGTFFLVVFAFGEIILFAWVFGIQNGWTEMLHGAEMKVPRVFYYVMKYVTPIFLLIILLGFVFQPEGSVPDRDPRTGAVKRDAKTGKELTVSKGWEPYVTAPFTGESPPEWEWSGSGMIGKLLHRDLTPPGPTASPVEQQFYEDVKFYRTIDRLVMLGTFTVLAGLVWVAWRRRRAEGRA